MPSNSLRDKDQAYALHPYTDLRAHERCGPMVITRGEGVRVFDENGKGYIEGLAGLWCVSLGYTQPRLVEAARKQMDTLPFSHVFRHKAHEPGIELAEKLIEMAPVPMSKVFFANSGSEANDTVIKMIWYYSNALGRPEKKKIISRVKAYHGVTVASASLTRLPANNVDFDLPIDRIIHTTCPHAYHEAEPGESDEVFAARLAKNLEDLILSEGPDTIAAFIAEPVMGAGGVIVPPETYFSKIVPVCRKYDILVVADEVICGFYRTGNLWGSQTFGIEPDILTCAKALSSAYLPISAVMVNDRVFQAIADNSAKLGTFGHGYTYSAHPVPAAVALETLALYEDLKIGEHVAEVAPVMQAHLKSLGAHPLVGEARGVGMIGALELVEDKAARKNFDPKRGIGAKVMDTMEKHGALIRAMMNDSLGFAPPLVITKAELDELFGIVRTALDEVAAEVL